jgi:hypothetical protein
MGRIASIDLYVISTTQAQANSTCSLFDILIGAFQESMLEEFG